MSIPWTSFPEFRQRAIHFIAGNRAALDIDQAMRVAPKKSDHPILHMDRDSIAIFVLLRRRDDRSQRKIFELADSLENIAHLPPFDRQLMFVVNVLVRAPAAMAKIGALWPDTMRRAFLDFHELRLSELFFFPHDLRRNQFALNGVRNEDSLPLLAADPFSAESEVFDF